MMQPPSEPDANLQSLRALIADLRIASALPEGKDRDTALLLVLQEHVQRFERQNRLRAEHDLEDVDRYHLGDLSDGDM